jgi:hypothetical protein
MTKPNRILPIEDSEIKNGFRVAVTKICNAEEGRTLRRPWMQFASLNNPFNKPDAREYHNDLSQVDPIGWWTMHEDGAPDIQHLVVRLMSHIDSSFIEKRNLSTYSFIHYQEE